MVNGDNSNANYDYNNQGVCGARSDRRAIWYEINGVGKEVTVNICTNNDKITDFGIFRACNTQNCLGAPPQQLQPANCDDQENNTHSFLAKTGDNYYVHVRSDVVFEGEGSNVSFSKFRLVSSRLVHFNQLFKNYPIFNEVNRDYLSKYSLFFYFYKINYRTNKNHSLRYGTQSPQMHRH